MATVSDGDSAGESSKDRIRKSAAIEFATYGYAGARVDRIAAAARANKQLIYRYFGSKSRLYDSVLSGLTGELRKSLARDQELSIPYFDRFVASAGVAPERMKDLIAWTRLLAWEGLQPSSFDDSLLEILRGNYAIQADRLAADSRAAAALSRFPARLVLALLIAADHLPFSTPTVFAALLGKDSTSEQDVHDWFQFVVDFIAAIGGPDQFSSDG